MAFPSRANPPSWFAPWRQDRPADARLLDDVVAAVIVTLLLIPQSLAYAVLAGVPAHLGLYASIFPLLAYAAFGRSPVLAVGPVALTSIMTLDALQGYAVPGSPEWIAAATFLALASGALLFAMGALRLGFLAQLLSHPVMSGFVSGTAILIVLGQLKTLTGIPVQGQTAPELIQSFFQGLGQFESVTIVTGVTSLLLIALGRRFIRPWLTRQPIPTTTAELLGRAVPLVVVALATVVLMVSGMASETRTVGTIPSGLPSIGLPALDVQGLQGLLLSAALIGLVGFIESVSMAQTMARRFKVPVDPDAELRGLGAANLASGVIGAFPVTGGLTRTVVNIEAGARSPVSSILSAGLLLLVLLGAGNLLHDMPLAALAALIIVAVSTLIDIKALRHAWQFDRIDATSWLITFFGVLVLGLETGIVMGIVLSASGILWRLSRPHIAVLGRMPGTEHFRNVNRHHVETLPHALFLRIDGNLFFGNWVRIREAIDAAMESHPGTIAHLVLNLASVSDIDTTALEGMIRLQDDLQADGIGLCLAEIRGPVGDKLAGQALKVPIFLSSHDAFEALAGKPD